jgi:hypothetical protein
MLRPGVTHLRINVQAVNINVADGGVPDAGGEVFALEGVIADYSGR